MTPERQEAKLRAEVMLAFSNGHHIECKLKDRPDLEWNDTQDPCWDWVLYDYRVNPNPAVNWDAMPAWANCVVKEIVGGWWWYSSKPIAGNNGWGMASDNMHCGRIPSEYAPKYAGTKPWNELIIERPKK